MNDKAKVWRWAGCLSFVLAACGGDRGLLDARSDTGVSQPDRAMSEDGSQGSDAAMDASAGDDASDAAAVMDARDTGVGMDASDSGAATDASDGATAMDARDASDGSDASDASVDVRADSAADSASADARADSASGDAADGGAPTGRCAPMIDGVVGSDWSSNAIVASNGVASTWGNTNQLRALRVCYDSANLYLGIEGTSEAINAMVLYFDRDFGGVTITGVRDFATLTDNTGALDNRVSAPYTITAAGFGAEAAYGTNGPMGLLDTALSDNAGLRLIAPIAGGADRRADFAWTMGAAQTCAGASDETRACEVRIAWSALYEGPRPATARVAMFARINNNDGTASSNQTLPIDDPSAPRTIGRVLVLDVN